MSETFHCVVHFSYDSAFLVNLAREGYWFEGRKDWALDLLACFDGITTEQTMKLLRGEASMTGINGALYVNSPDEPFQKKLREYQDWLREAELKKSLDLEKERLHILSHAVEDDPRVEIDPDDESLLTERARLLRNAAKTHDFFMQLRPEKPKQILPPSDPVKLGAFTVSKSLLDSYLEVASDHDLMEPWDAGMAIYYSGKMMNIHLQLRESVGLEGYWGRKGPSGDPDDFDEALQAAVHANNKKDERYKLRQRQIRAQRQERAQASSHLKRTDDVKSLEEGIPYNPDDDNKRGE